MSITRPRRPSGHEPPHAFGSSTDITRRGTEVCLSWQPGFSISRKPFKKTRVRRRPEACSVEGGARQYDFIIDDYARLCVEQDEGGSSLGTYQDASGTSAARLTTLNVDCSLCVFSALPNNVQFLSLAHRFDPIFEQYDADFCVIPLTNSMRINPFQCPRVSFTSNPSLMHAVLALAGHHLNARVSEDHQQAAMQALRRSIDSRDQAVKWLGLIDTIIILFSLEESRSAFGHWRTHLTGAYSVLQAAGDGVWLNAPRAIAQVGILTWWDATASLMSRQSCVIPYAFFEATLAYQDDETWDMFGLCGCPQSLAVAAIQLAHLAADKHKALATSFVTCNETQIKSIEQSLENWQHTPAADAWLDEEHMHQDADRRHCSEAWKCGLLLYIYRIFQWRCGETVPVRILHTARTLADHVFACRNTGYLAKQAALPLFWAGCELSDMSLRDRIAEYCTFWSEKSRYRLLDDIMPLLREVWLAQEIEGPENVSWTSIVDRRHASGQVKGLPLKTICLG